MSRVVISCGGTGGHLSPGIALAEALIQNGHECTLLLSRKQVDSRLVRKYPNLRCVAGPGAGFSLHPVRFLVFVVQQIRSLAFSFRLLREVRPHVIVAFGGFLSLGVSLAGYFRGCPIAFHEANRVPGKATRLLSGFAARLYLPEGIRIPRIPPQVIRHLGYPVRKDVRRIPVNAARERLGLNVPGRLLVVIGGSQGAQVLNQWVLDRFAALGAEGISVLCVTGLGKGNEGVVEHVRPNGEKAYAYFLPFTDDMGAVLSAADLVVSRAGAGAIAELAHCHAASILIPYPFAADNHQIANARFLERQGGCVVVDQSQMHELRREVEDTIFNDWLLNRIRENLRRLNRGDTAAEIAADLIRISDQRGGRAGSPAPHPA